MAEVKWIKIVTDIFDDEKMLLIESLPSADSLIVVWFKLLCLAGKNNNNGVFLMNNKIPYTEEMLSTIFRRDINTIRLALKTFEEFGMIEIIDGVITIPNWGKHQTLDAYEKKKERDRLYQEMRRAKQKEIAEKSSDKSSDVAVSDKEEDIEEDKNKNNILSSLRSDNSSIKTDYEEVIKLWNELDGLGNITSVKAISPGSKRYQNVKARLKTFGIEGFKDAIENVKRSSFLQGKNTRGWTITFDWFVLPSNFQKVLEGNYNDKADKENWLDL